MMKVFQRATMVAGMLAVLFFSTWRDSYASTAQCPPLVPNSGVTAITIPIWPGGNPAACDTGFTVGTSSMIVQGPVTRHYFKITNTSASGGNNLGICFTRLELSSTCTMANAGTILTPGQSFYQAVTMYAGITQLFNSMFFNGSMIVVGSGASTGVAVSID